MLELGGKAASLTFWLDHRRHLRDMPQNNLAVAEAFDFGTVCALPFRVIDQRLKAASNRFKAALLIVRVEAAVCLATATIVRSAFGSTVAGTATAW